MRYKVQILDSLGGLIVVITDYVDTGRRGIPSSTMYAISDGEIHTDRLEEILCRLGMLWGESHP